MILAQGNNNIYFSTSGAAVNSDNLTEGSTNLYFSTARVRSNVSVTDTGGDGSLTYNSTTGVFTYTGPDQDDANTRIDNASANVRAHFGNTEPIQFNTSTGVYSLNTNFNDDGNLNRTHYQISNVTLKEYYDTTDVQNNVSGNVLITPSSQGQVIRMNLVGNVTSLGFSPATNYPQTGTVSSTLEGNIQTRCCWW